MENMEIYEKFRNVPENAVKPFDNGSFKGTDINTMWRIKCLTEQFGPVGKGWYIRPERTWKEDIVDEVYVFMDISLFVKYPGETEWSAPIYGTGGNKLVKYVKSSDRYKGSDEAYKMAATDAFGNACKYLGIGADVYWENDKTKYTEKEEISPVERKKADRKAVVELLRKSVSSLMLRDLAEKHNCLKLGEATDKDFVAFAKELKDIAGKDNGTA